MNGNAPTLISGGAEARALARDDQIAGERKPERPRQHVAVGGADGRLAELADEPEQAREARGAEMLVHERLLLGEAAEVRARGKDLLVRGGEHDAADGLVVARGLERGDQLVQHLVGQCVAGLGLVERDGGHAARGDLVAQGLEGHGRDATDRARGGVEPPRATRRV